MADVKSLGTELPKEIARVQNEVLPAYRAIGPAGIIGATFIQVQVNAALNALESGDVVAMAKAYCDLKSVED